MWSPNNDLELSRQSC